MNAGAQMPPQAAAGITGAIRSPIRAADAEALGRDEIDTPIGSKGGRFLNRPRAGATVQTTHLSGRARFCGQLRRAHHQTVATARRHLSLRPADV
jgi:hypothetical protein